MLTEQTITLAAAILAFVASVIATAVSAYNARLAKFAQQKWWERKVDAYTRIVEGLAQMVYYYEEHLAAHEERRDIPAERKAEIDQHWERSYSELKSATAVGAFLVSADADAALQQMWQEQGKGVDPDDWYGLLESEYVCARDCLNTVVSAAKADLRKASW